MEDYCMVIAGEWKYGDGRWTFETDKLRMSCIVPLRHDIPLPDLQNSVRNEFIGSTEPPHNVVLSYWPPNIKELATGLTTPPVILTNDVALKFFFMHLEAHRGMNLFATFEIKGESKQTSHADDSHLPFTPNQPIKPTHNSHHPPSTACSKIPGFSLFDDDDFLDATPVNRPADAQPDPESPYDGPPKTKRFSIVDETLACGDEMLQEMFKDDPDNIPDSWVQDEEDDYVSEDALVK